MPPPEKPAPLPLAPDRAALSNRISLLISSQSSVLKSMNLSSSRASSTRRPQSFQDADDNDDSDLFRSRPNEGVGYIPDRAQTTKDALSKEDKMLRGRILGKRGAEKVRRKVEEDEEDDDPGRSSLGKRKRPRRAVEETTAPQEEPVVPATHHDVEDDADEPSPDEPNEEVIPASKESSGLDVAPKSASTEDTSSQKTPRKKKKTKKKKD